MALKCCKCSRTFGTKEKLRSHVSVDHLDWLPYQCSFCDGFLPTDVAIVDHIQLRHPGNQHVYRYHENAALSVRFDQILVECDQLNSATRNKPTSTSVSVPSDKSDQQPIGEQKKKEKHRSDRSLSASPSLTEMRALSTALDGDRFEECAAATDEELMMALSDDDDDDNAMEESDEDVKGKGAKNESSEAAIQRRRRKKKTAEESPAKTYKCPDCSKVLSVINRRRHSLTHTGARPFRCDLCPKAYTDASSLKTHKRAAHTGDKPYKCDRCGERFADASFLKIHKRFENGERPFKCSQCPLTFYISSHLHVHERTHSGAKPYKCERCDKQFRQSHHLKRHLSLHDVPPKKKMEMGKKKKKTAKKQL